MNFTYTKKDWDKARPMLLKSTGLGDALKKYEAIKEKVKHVGQCGLYVDAQLELAKVEKAREGAIKECGTKYTDAKKYLESADPKAELGFLGAFIGNHLVNYLGKARPDLDKKMERVRNRVKVLQVALPIYQDPEKLKTINPKLEAAVRQMLLEDGDDKKVSVSYETGELLEAANPKYRLKTNDALKSIVEKCAAIAEEMKTFKEVQAQAESLARELLPLVPEKK
jgi:hypothetical protein